MLSGIFEMSANRTARRKHGREEGVDFWDTLAAQKIGCVEDLLRDLEDFSNSSPFLLRQGSKVS